MTLALAPLALGVLPALAALGLVCALLLGPRLCALVCAAAGLFGAALFAAAAMGAPAAGMDVALGPWPTPIGQSFTLDAFTAGVAAAALSLAALSSALDLQGGVAGAGLKLAGAALAALSVTSGELVSAILWLGGANLTLAAAASLADARAARGADELFGWRALALAVALIGLALVHSEAGRLDFAGLPAALSGVGASPRLAGGLGLAVAGLMGLSGAAPLHGGAARTAPAAGLSWTFYWLALGLAGAAALVRLAGAFEGAEREGFALTLAIAGCAGLAAGALQAAATLDLRRLAVHAFASHLAAALLSAAAGGAGAAVLLPAAGALSAAGIATAAVLLAGLSGDTGAAALAGAGRAKPWAGALAGVALLSAIGAPLTVGFAARLDLAEALAERGWLAAVGVLVLSSLLGVTAAARWLDVVFAQSPAGAEAAPKRPARALAALGALAALAMIAWGVSPPPAAFFRAADAVERLHGG